MDQEQIAHLAYLDELVALQEGYEKLAAKRKKEPGIPTAAAIPAGAALGYGVPRALEAAGVGERGEQARLVRAQKKELKGLRKEVARTKTMLRHPDAVVRREAEKRLPQLEKQLGRASTMWTHLKKFPTPRITPRRGLIAGAVAAPVVTMAARKYMKNK